MGIYSFFLALIIPNLMLFPQSSDSFTLQALKEKTISEAVEGNKPLTVIKISAPTWSRLQE